MAPKTKLGLTRIVLLSPQRRVDLAVPEYLPLVTLLPALLRHAGTGLADEGVSHHGWVLRQVDGTVLDSRRSLAALGTLDGETLLLSPQDQHWPEPAYDDLAEAVGHEARGAGAVWSGPFTRRAGVLATTLLLVLGLALALRAGPPWTVSGLSLSVVAVLVFAAAVAAARLRRDTGIALILAAAAYSYATPGAILLAGPTPVGLPQALVGCATLVLIAVLSLIAIGTSRQVHLAILTMGVLLGLAGFLAVLTTLATGAAVTAAVLLLVAPWLPRLAAYQGGMPTPVVPRPSIEVPPDEAPMPPRQVSTLVRRSDEVMTGLLHGMCATLLLAALVLATRRDLSAGLLAVAVAIVCALRARAFPAVRHRLPLLGVAGLASVGLPVLFWESLAVESRVTMVAPVLALALLAAVLAFAAGRTYAVKQPSPQLGRVGDIGEFVLITAGAVLAVATTGLFGYVRGLGG